MEPIKSGRYRANKIVSKTGIRAIQSKLGWVLLGQVNTVVISTTMAIDFLQKAKERTPQYPTQDLNSNRNDEPDFAKWWKLESLDPLKNVPLSVCWNSYADSIKQDEDGHYVAPLTFHESKQNLSKFDLAWHGRGSSTGGVEKNGERYGDEDFIRSIQLSIIILNSLSSFSNELGLCL